MTDKTTWMAATLASHPLLSRIDAETRDQLVTYVVSYKAGRTVLREGSEPDAVYFLLSGGVRIFHRNEDDAEVLLKLLRAPAMFGEIEILAKRPNGESVITIEATQALRLPAAEFRRLIMQSPSFALAAFEDVAERFCITVRNMRNIAFFEVSSRLASLLLDYAAFGSENTPAGLVVATRLSQEAMARDLAVSRKAVQQALLDLQKIVSREDGRYVIKDKAELERRAGFHAGVSYSSR